MRSEFGSLGGELVGEEYGGSGATVRLQQIDGRQVKQYNGSFVGSRPAWHATRCCLLTSGLKAQARRQRTGQDQRPGRHQLLPPAAARPQPSGRKAAAAHARERVCRRAAAARVVSRPRGQLHAAGPGGLRGRGGAEGVLERRRGAVGGGAQQRKEQLLAAGDEGVLEEGLGGEGTRCD
jgi:hypothetical protein